ncbi:MAG TPA: ribosome small subunit-dependent GTPase A [Acidimicrobiia bacterium]|jgi:ribosome biogenesis GTPase|nr:ribosome small subunit-dependent GTPase A [Acidimicrobiia bacterium]
MSAVPAELARLGWDDERAAEAAARVEPNDVVGRVGRVDRGWITVFTGRKPLRARAAGLGRHRDPMRRPAVGDWVIVRGDALVEVLPRRSALVRGVTEGGTDAAAAQVVAANVDRVFIVHAIDVPLRARRLERELVVVHDAGAEPVVVLTKAELVDDVDARVGAARAVVGSVAVHAVSARTTAGMDALRASVEPGRTVAIIGPSGAGKSTLINGFVGEELLPTGEVRENDRRGRHTTVARDLVLLDSGGIVVDTPGLRSVGLWDSDDGFEEAFADVEALARDCRFADCLHRSEPGCAVRAAVARGDLDEDRVDAYVHLDAELDRLADREVERDREERRRANQRPRPS